MYVELVEGNKKNRGNIVELSSVGRKIRDVESYISLFPFDKGIIPYVKSKKSVSGYKGGVYLHPALFVDVDKKDDNEGARQSALSLIDRLMNDYGVDQEDLWIYFSGNKGFHLGIPSWMIGAEQSSDCDIPKQCENFVKKLCEGIPNIDSGIYNPNRIFRIVNSRHQDSGLYKIPLTFDQLNTSVDEIRVLAEEPNQDFLRKASSKIVNENLKALWNISVPGQVLDKSEVSSTGLFSPKMSGDRNTTAFKQAAILLKQGIHRGEVWNVMLLANAQNNPPLPEVELRTCYESALRTVKQEIKDVEISQIGGFMNEWEESIRDEKNKISLIFPVFDHEMQGKLRGKLCCVIHYGGTKKSLLAQNISYHNVINNDQRVVYSSMEMGVPELIGRFIDLIVEGEYTNASVELEQLEKTNPSAVRLAMDNISAAYGDKLFLTPTSGMETSDYKKVLDKTISETGPVDILVVDGLSMMGGKDDETALVSRHTKELKELAKDYNIFVITIVHASKGGEKYHRDVSQRARGSEKIIDNCDFYICPSLIVKETLGDEKEYEDDRGFLRLVNKRGSGRTIDTVYNFNKKRLLMTQSPQDAREIDRNNPKERSF
jgi:archaellum biogenesis ATPase FlaH